MGSNWQSVEVYQMIRLNLFILAMLLGACSNSPNSGPINTPTQYYPVKPNWIELFPDPNPPPRYDHGMMYFPPMEGVILFGGRGVNDSSAAYSDTWLFNKGKWVEMQDIPSPSPRYRFGIAFDSLREKIVIYGGIEYNSGNYNYSSETWEFDGTEWHHIETANTPTSQAGHSMVFIKKIGKTVLFGGQNSEGVNPNETWTYDGIDWQMKNIAENPGIRLSPAMVYNPVKETVLMFGGSMGSHKFNDTWEFDGYKWSEITPEHRPTGRSLFAMVYNEYLDRVLLFGGSGKTNHYLNDTWQFDGVDWSELKPEDTPPGRLAHSMVYCPIYYHNTILFGGSNSSGDPPYTKGDTWKYSVVDQTQDAPALNICFVIILVAFISVLIFAGAKRCRNVNRD